LLIPTLSGSEVFHDLANEGLGCLGTQEFQQQITGEGEVVALQREALDIGNVNLTHEAGPPRQFSRSQCHRAAEPALSPTAPAARRTLSVFQPRVCPGFFR